MINDITVGELISLPTHISTFRAEAWMQTVAEALTELGQLPHEALGNSNHSCYYARDLPRNHGFVAKPLGAVQSAKMPHRARCSAAL